MDTLTKPRASIEVDDEDIVVREQQQISVYTNIAGDVVIVQSKDRQIEEDAVVVVQLHHVKALIDALLKAARGGQ